MPKYAGFRARFEELRSTLSGDREGAALEAARQADAAEIGRRADQRRRDRAPEQPMPAEPVEDQAGDEPPDASDAR